MAVNITQLNLPNDIPFADPQFCQPADVDMLLGAEIFFDILCPERISLGPNMPVLQNTLFGWIVAGPLSPSLSKPPQKLHCNFTREISEKLTKFWNLEELPSSKIPTSADDEFCEEHFIKNTYRLPDGRFSVLMPLKESPEIALGDSYKMAAKRFYNLEKKLVKNPELKRRYSEFIHEYGDLGHLTKIERPKFGYYLPHHCVLRDHSESTKLRVVFDASAKSASQKSLNDIQYIGPVVQDDLFNILIRFRQHQYVFTGDIEKCYRQIKIHESQRNLQLILWRDDASKPLDVLQLNTVTYGTASAPYLSTRCLLQLAHECPDPVISEVIKKDCYMDDLLTVSVPRHVFGSSPAACELHCFVDASQEAYAACVYVRTTDYSNCVTVKLLCAKTRVSPLKVMTIPRLELSAALLGARLVAKVSEALRCTIHKKTFWSDSTITLGWIKTQPKLLKTFVCNRINEIHELTNRNSWRHVPTEMNPADMASRGVDPSHLLNSSLWWEGPDFLKDNEWHFLIGRPLTSIPSPPAVPERSMKTRYQLIETLRESFWTRWKNEYLKELQRKTKWRHPYKNIKEGAMVVFKDDNQPPTRWKLARVHRLYPGKDGVCRVADFRTIRGVERRALNRVCPLLEDDDALEPASVPAVPANPSASPTGPQDVNAL
ncbi:hypothetical protein MSG28_004803 [Choristoneura fumiferana]|uniref:Uncharacterized protein n=1 Tax=Choristoneura fumiferana TaxID=7141 RepID=A0ACC0K8Q5_CHOFU|nr:hypothetical protein MSG28_004803 [Choristoneura fumiferana]